MDSFDASYRSIPSRLSMIVPDSLGEAELKYVCGRRNAGIHRGRATVSSGQGRINRQQAVDLILKWLSAKNEIFAPPFARSQIDQLITGKLRNGLTTSGSPIGWLRQIMPITNMALLRSGQLSYLRPVRIKQLFKLR